MGQQQQQQSPPPPQQFIPMYQTNQFSSNIAQPVPFNLSDYTNTTPGTTSTIATGVTTTNANDVNTKPGPFEPGFLSYPNYSNDYMQQQQQQQQQITSASPFLPPNLQTYSTYPQQQQIGTSLTTPISLPGMPPISVSTTIPSQQLEGIQFNQNNNNNNNNNNQFILH